MASADRRAIVDSATVLATSLLPELESHSGQAQSTLSGEAQLKGLGFHVSMAVPSEGYLKALFFSFSVFNSLVGISFTLLGFKV